MCPMGLRRPLFLCKTAFFMIHISHWVFMTGCHVKFKVQIVLCRNYPPLLRFFDENYPNTQFLARTKHMCTKFNLSATNWYMTCMTGIECSRDIGEKRQKIRHQLLFSNWKYIIFYFKKLINKFKSKKIIYFDFK